MRVLIPIIFQARLFGLPASGKVKIEQTDTDRYGRVVGIVFINDTLNLNERLLEAGLA